MSSTSFHLARLTADDVPEIVDIQYLTSTSPIIRKVFMAPDTAEGRASLVERYRRTMRNQPHDVWIKIVDKSNGRIVAASNWKIYASCVPEPFNENDLRWLAGAELEKANAIWAGIGNWQRRNMTQPCLELRICFTHPQYQRQGAATMMLKWGAQLADQLFLPTWLASSAQGMPLYKKHGFEEVRDVDDDASTGVHMLRKPRSRSAVP